MSTSISAEISPVNAPLPPSQQFWVATSNGAWRPSSAWFRYTNGAPHTTSVSLEMLPAFSSEMSAATLSLVPFIFQFPPTMNLPLPLASAAKRRALVLLIALLEHVPRQPRDLDNNGSGNDNGLRLGLLLEEVTDAALMQKSESVATIFICTLRLLRPKRSLRYVTFRYARRLSRKRSSCSRNRTIDNLINQTTEQFVNN